MYQEAVAACPPASTHGATSTARAQDHARQPSALVLGPEGQAWEIRAPRGSRPSRTPGLHPAGGGALADHPAGCQPGAPGLPGRPPAARSPLHLDPGPGRGACLVRNVSVYPAAPRGPPKGQDSGQSRGTHGLSWGLRHTAPPASAEKLKPPGWGAWGTEPKAWSRHQPRGLQTARARSPARGLKPPAKGRLGPPPSGRLGPVSETRRPPALRCCPPAPPAPPTPLGDPPKPRGPRA